MTFLRSGDPGENSPSWRWSAPRLTLHAAAANEAALGLYRKLGFTPQRELRLLISE